jgi:hypothetical protein
MNNVEIVTGNAPTVSNLLPIATATKLPHNRNDLVTSLFGDRIKIYTAPDQYGTGQQPDDANFTLVQTIQIDPSQKLSTFTDSGGGAGFWYKYTYLNQSTGIETDRGTSKAVRGDQGQNYCSLSQIRRAAGFTNAPYITDDLIDEFRQAAQAEVVSTIGGLYNMPLPQPTNPLIVQITKDLAAGMLMVDQHQTMNPSRAKEGEAKIANAQATLIELATKVMVLRDASFLETVIDNIEGFGSNSTDGISYTDTAHSDYDSSINPPNDNPTFGVKDKY